jgi:Flp pilus assembly protein TadG
LRSICRFLKNSSGQALVELAITLPVLMLILCGIIDFGWLFTNQLALSYCSREGARYAVVHAEGEDAQTNIENRVFDVAPDYMRSNMTVTVTFSNAASPRMGDVDVSVEAGVAALTPVIGILEPGQIITLSSKCVMKVE